jgi:TP901 family phage tail tape measure protein
MAAKFDKIHERALRENEKRTLQLDPTPAITSLNKFATHLASVSQRLRTFGYLTSAVVTLPLVMAGKAAMNTAMDFEFTMKKMIGLAGMAKESMTAFGNEIKNISSKTGVGLIDVADTFYFIKSSGIEAAQSLVMTEMAAKGAASGMGEAKDIANLLTSAMNAYAKEGLTAERMMNVLTATIREGKAEPAAMVNAFGTILPIAQKLGLGIEQVGGAIATMTLITNSTATSATYLRNVLMKLLDPSPQVIKAFGDMGTSVEQIHNMLRKPDGFMKTMEFLGIITKKWGKTMADVFPEMRSLLGALNFTGEGLNRLKTITKATDESMGAFQKHFEEMATTMRVRWNRALADSKIALADIGVVIAKTVTPWIEKLVEKLNKLTTHFNLLTEAQQRHKIQWLVFLAAIGPVSLLLSVVGYTISGLITIVGGLWKGLTFLSQVIRGVAGSVTAMDIAMARSVGWTKFVKLLINPWVLLTLAIGAAVIAATNYMKKMEELPPALQKLKDNIKGIIDEEKYINNKMSMLPEMDKSQLETLKSTLESRLQILKDSRIDILAYRENSLKDDKNYIRLQKDIKKDQENLDKWMSKPVKIIKLEGYDEQTKKVKEAQKVLYDYAVVTYGYKRGGVPSINTTDDTWNKLSQKIFDAQKKLQDFTKEGQKSLNARLTIKDFTYSLEQDKKALATYLGGFDTSVGRINGKIADTETAIGKVTDRLKEFPSEVGGVGGVTAGVKEVYDYFKILEKLNKDYQYENKELKRSKPVFEAQPDYKKLFLARNVPGSDVMTNFGKELELIAVKNKALGDTYNTLRDKVNYFKNILNNLWDNGLRPGMPLMDEMMKRMKSLIIQQEITDTLTSAFADFFSITKEGFQNFGQFVQNWANDVLRAFQRLIAQHLAEKLANSLTGGLDKLMNKIGGGGGKDGGFLGFLGKILGLVGTVVAPEYGIPAFLLGEGIKGAKGGTVPRGFPNDTYPALLTSGETVIPKGLNNITQLQFEPVEFVIKENQLVGILRKANTRKQLT